MSVEQRLAEMSLSLPSLSKPRFRYVPLKRAGEIVHISGQVPRLADGSLLTGKVGSERSVEEAREAAKLCGLHILAVAKSITGSLDDIEMLKVFGMVNAVPDFGDQPLVIDGRVVSGPNAITGEWGHNSLPWPQADELPGPDAAGGLSR